jgi:predicted NAD/FAD-binding protein
MSFSVQNTLTGLEYNGHDLNTLFSQRRNLFRPKFWRLILEIVRFNKLAKACYQEGEFLSDKTLGDFLNQHNFSDYFAEHYILPMTAAIWSTSLKEALAFPLPFFIQFFYHHGLLNIQDRPQWYVIPGGSRNYVDNLTMDFADNIHLNTDIKQVLRHDKGVSIVFADETTQEFDEVVLACHSDQALALLGDPTELETEILSAMPYSSNEVVLHLDEKMLPKKKLSWASWNYKLDDNADNPAAVTYNMNILMGLQSEHTFCVTLNQTEQIAPEKILRKFNYHHPIINPESFAAQKRRKEICGKNHTHFAGAYWYQGFHEDGVKSGLDVAARFGMLL